ncbi:MAG: sialidase [Sphingobacteriales bacterium 17-39-43]|nr:MAG: sialidase [Sphingobacteriales bacterium 16-39-50]OZA22715.1 MAG: sialidase [Sphingobacteriales bacterium 17-39-43]
MPLLGQNSAAQTVSKQSAWQKIAPYFAVPDQFKDQFGPYRSPLKFYDGREVKNPAEWKKRRIEVLDRWNGLMGKWPALITDQKLEFLDSVSKESFTQYQVRFNWVPGQKTIGYLMVPHGKGKKPAVITVYYEPETAAGLGRPDLPDRDFAYQLCKRGFVTLSLGTTESTNSKTYSIYYPGIQNASVQPLSMLAYAAANAWNVLAKVKDVDSKRIGIMGHSYGGKWAMFASCLYEKFACAVWSDPGIVFEDSRESINYWEPWYLGYHPQPWRKRGLITNDNPAKGLYPKLVSEGYNLQELHALMAPRPFLVSGGSEDPANRWIPLNHSVAVNDLLGYKNRVAMTNRPEHTPNLESNEVAYSFLEYYLKY